MARNKGTFQFAANFEVKAAAALDPRVAVATKAELISKETWPYDGDTIYLYKGILVSVQDENAVYMLVDYDKILSADYSGWLRVDAGNAEQVEVVDNLESDASDKALSAKQGKVLMGEVSGIKQKIASIYSFKGSVDNFEALPTNAVAGDVYNVVAANGNIPAGTNYAWNGTEWDALGGSIDLSNYFNKEEVNAAIKVEADRAKGEEARIEGLVNGVSAVANEAKNLATDNQASLTSVSKSLGDLNLLLNGNDDDTDDIPNQLGIVGRLEAVEDLIGAPSENDKENTMLARLNALEELVTGGEGGEGEQDQTLLQKVNQNTLDISALETRMGTAEGKISALETATEGLDILRSTVADHTNILLRLNGDAQTEGSVDYKIDQAFTWINV